MIANNHCKQEKGCCQHRANKADIGSRTGKHIKGNAGITPPKKVIGNAKPKFGGTWIPQLSEKVVHGLIQLSQTAKFLITKAVKVGKAVVKVVFRGDKQIFHKICDISQPAESLIPHKNTPLQLGFPIGAIGRIVRMIGRA